jgi:hypothetical protein
VEFGGGGGEVGGGGVSGAGAVVVDVEAAVDVLPGPGGLAPRFGRVVERGVCGGGVGRVGDELAVVGGGVGGGNDGESVGEGEPAVLAGVAECRDQLWRRVRGDVEGLSREGADGRPVEQSAPLRVGRVGSGVVEDCEGGVTSAPVDRRGVVSGVVAGMVEALLDGFGDGGRGRAVMSCRGTSVTKSASGHR